VAVLTLAVTVFVAVTIAVDLVRATRARLRTGERFPGALGALLLRHNRRYGGFVVHLGILIVAIGVTGSQAWSVQTETTLRRGEHTDLAGYRVRFDGLAASEESNHFKVTGTFTVANGRASDTVLHPAKKFYPQEQSPIAYVDYRLGLREDVYLVLGDFARDGSQATIRLQVNRLVSWIWIGGLVLTLGAALALAPERRRTGAVRSAPA
jgi:cytochrome c-type biogenesis protein CcmF